MTGKNSSVLIVGASGMLGNTMLRLFAASPGFVAWGSARSSAVVSLLPADLRDRVLIGIDVDDPESLRRAFEQSQPDVVINCVGLVKQLAEAVDPLQAIPINSLLPHRLGKLCLGAGARLVHVSTDCVFSGAKGMYTEQDLADATDLYGRSKLLGEVDQPHAVTLRTSIIGHELGSAHGLAEWFLAQKGPVRGFSRAVFSGLPTVELARVVRDHVLPHPELHGLYHVSAEPISKYELLWLLAQVYGRTNEIARDETLVIDRSLDSSRFRAASGYTPPPWPELVRAMRDFG